MEESQVVEFGLDRRNEDMRRGACQNLRDIEYAMCVMYMLVGCRALPSRMKGILWIRQQSSAATNNSWHSTPFPFCHSLAKKLPRIPKVKLVSPVSRRSLAIST